MRRYKLRSGLCVWTIATCCLQLAGRAHADRVQPLAAIGAAKNITLDEAIRIAIHQNPTLAASVVDVRIADAQILEASGIDDFALEGDSRWLSTRTQSGGQANETPFDHLRIGASLTRPLPSGGALGFTFATDYTRFISADSTMKDNHVFARSMLLALSHPLLRGSGVAVARAERRRAHVARDVAALRKAATVAAVILDVSQVYWELAFSTAEVEIRRASVDLAREQLRAVLANIEGGKQPPSASAEVEVAIASREEELLVAEQMLRSRSLELRQLLGREIGAIGPTLFASDRPTDDGPITDLDQDQLLINLVQNAVDAALETRGAVSVGWHKTGSYLEVLVSDEGPGIANSDNLFVPFFTTKPNGSGIGLVLSRQIAEAHKGSLTLQNRQQTSGCIARLILPLQVVARRPGVP